MILAFKNCLWRTSWIINSLGKQVRWMFHISTKHVQSKSCTVSSNAVAHMSSTSQQQKLTPDNPEWITIFRFPYIVQARLISRLKIYQTAGTVLLLIPASVMYTNGSLDLNVLLFIVGLTSFANVMLYIMGNITRRLIGIIYVDNNKEFLKVARLTFWGNRKDEIIPIKDVIPLTECENNLNDFYLKLNRYSTKNYLLFCIKYGGIVHDALFHHVFHYVPNKK